MQPAPHFIAALAVRAAATASVVVLASCSQAGLADVWYIEGAKIYEDPVSPPIADGVVIVREGKIVAVGETGETTIPEGARRSTCAGVLAAGFQNSHVHFIAEDFAGAAEKPAAELSRSVNRMIARYGYTTVVDVGSELENTLALRRRIESGEIPGPRVLIAASPLFPHQGLPTYLSHLPDDFRNNMLQPETAEEAIEMIRGNLDAGADATKLFLVTPQRTGDVKRMDADIALSAAEETHARGKLVFAHPTDIEGVRRALAAGVDILTHTTLGAQTLWPDDLLDEAVNAGLAKTPTLKLLGYELRKENVPVEIAPQIIAGSVAQTRAFAEAGGVILFGTDVGYMTDFDPTTEYELLADAGLSPMHILASLTTAPAEIWKEGDRRGRLAPGMDADIVALAGDPAEDPANFANVACAFRGGALIYDASR